MADDTLLRLEQWRQGAPRVADEVAAEWGLTLGEPYAPGMCGHVVRATTADGEPAVLKVSFPDHETLQEPDALERWNGDGAIRLLARDDERSAFLLERCEPGAFLSTAGGELALDVLIGLLPRLWVDAAGFRTVEEEVEHWIAQRLPGDVAALARDLASSQGEQVLVHQDLHGDNVLSAEREPWLVIDPKPLAGERELGVVAIVRSPELGHSRREVFHRIDRLSEALGLDRERVQAWTFVHTTAWSVGASPQQLEVIEWLR